MLTPGVTLPFVGGKVFGNETLKMLCEKAKEGKKD